jgi:exodeoxyribonuclease V beta subunit
MTAEQDVTLATAAFDPFAPLPPLQVVEASAGTGKTWNLATVVTRLVAGDEAVGPWPIESILVVTYTRAATAELRDRIRSRLQETLRRLDAGDPAQHDALSAHLAKGPDPDGARDRLSAAVAGFDGAPVLTIHGFCQLVLRTSGLANPTAGWELTDDAADAVAEVCQDLLAEEGVEAADVAGRLARLVKATTARLANPTAALVPAPHPAASWWVEAVERAVARIAARHERRGELTYTRLLEEAHRLVTSGPGAADAVQWVRSRFPVACIDEFQDTDPLQWELFHRLYGGQPGSHLLAVGDPKQAIYGFRGADVHTYLAARRAGRIATLGTNWRADADLVRATNELFRPVEFGPGIRLADAAARDDAPARGLEGSGAGTPIRLRVVTSGEELPAGRADALVVDDLVEVTARLLAPGSSTIPQHGDPGRRPLLPDDVAVLVRTRVQADRVQRALQRHGIPAVRAGAGSVFETAAAHQWRLALAALQRPSSPGLARAAAVGWFLGHPAHEVAAFDDAALAAVQQQLADLAHLLRERGLPAVLAAARAGGLDERVLARPGGERDLTDLDHVAELLVADADATGLRGATALLNRLTALMAAADEDDDSEGTSRRVDADDRAVQVLTVHSAKGLEYPVVLAPFAWRRAQADGPLTLHDGDHRVLDVTRKEEWPTADRAAAVRRKEQSDQERREEELRLLYVAVTRAQHQVIAWQVVAPMRFGAAYSGPLPHVLFTAHPVSAGAAQSEADRLGHLHRLAGVGEGLLAVEEVGAQPGPPAAALLGSDLSDEPLAISVLRRPLDRDWRRWSFTSLAARDADAAGGDAAEVAGDEAAADDEVGAADPPPPGDEPPPATRWAPPIPCPRRPDRPGGRGSGRGRGRATRRRAGRHPLRHARARAARRGRRQRSRPPRPPRSSRGLHGLAARPGPPPGSARGRPRRRGGDAARRLGGPADAGRPRPARPAA